MADSQTLSYQVQSRDQQTLDLFAFNTRSKQQTKLLRETSDTWLNLHKDLYFTERYMGDPKVDGEAYTASSVFPYAQDLKGDLLIYHGMADDNVLFSHSDKLYKQLQDRAIAFESMDYPGKKHSILGKKTGIHLYNTITNFFDKLLNV